MIPAIDVPKRKFGLSSSVQVCGYYRRVSPKGDTPPPKKLNHIFDVTDRRGGLNASWRILAYGSPQQAAAIKRLGAGLDLSQLVAGGEAQDEGARAGFAKQL